MPFNSLFAYIVCAIALYPCPPFFPNSSPHQLLFVMAGLFCTVA